MAGRGEGRVLQFVRPTSPRSPLTLAALADDALLDRAFAWLCRRRRHFPDVADVWAFRRHWPTEKRRLQAELRAGHVQLGLLTRITKADGTVLDLWSARDALVLKALALTLAAHLPRSRRCTHLQGHGGAKGAVRAVVPALPAYQFVCKTDVRSYYDSIDHARLLDRLARVVPAQSALTLLRQSLGP